MYHMFLRLHFVLCVLYVIIITNRTIEDMNSMRKWWKCELQLLFAMQVDGGDGASLPVLFRSFWLVFHWACSVRTLSKPFKKKDEVCSASWSHKRRSAWTKTLLSLSLFLQAVDHLSALSPPGVSAATCLVVLGPVSLHMRPASTSFSANRFARLRSLVCPQWRPGHTPVNKQAQRTGEIHCDWFPGEQKGGRAGAAPWGPIKKQKVFKSTSGSWGEEWKDTFPSMLQLNMDSTDSKHETFSPQLKESFVS